MMSRRHDHLRPSFFAGNNENACGKDTFGYRFRQTGQEDTRRLHLPLDAISLSKKRELQSYSRSLIRGMKSVHVKPFHRQEMCLAQKLHEIPSRIVVLIKYAVFIAGFRL